MGEGKTRECEDRARILFTEFAFLFDIYILKENLHAEEICCIALRSSSDVEVKVRKCIQIIIRAAGRVNEVKVEGSPNFWLDIDGIRRGLEKATVAAHIDLVPRMIPNPDCVVPNLLRCSTESKARSWGLGKFEHEMEESLSVVSCFELHEVCSGLLACRLPVPGILWALHVADHLVRESYLFL